MKFTLNEEATLVETTVGDAANGKDIDMEIDHVDEYDEVYDALDGALKTNQKVLRRGRGDFITVLLEGEAGTGKTQRVRQWCKDRNMNLLTVQASVMDDTDLGGALSPSIDYTTAVRLASTEFDALDRPNSVLFLDEFNRAPASVRGTLLTLIADHLIPDARVKDEAGAAGMRPLHNLQLVIVAVNPDRGGRYNTQDELDPAELTRMERVAIKGDKMSNLKYHRKKYRDQIAQDQAEGDIEEATADEGRLKLAETILMSKDIDWDYADGSFEDGLVNNTTGYFVPRSFTLLLDRCDGTKKDLLKLWDRYCNKNKKGVVTRILSNYEDVKNKANDLIKNRETDSAMIKEREKTEADFIKDFL